MPSKILLLISDKPADRDFAAEVSAVAELELKIVSRPAEGALIIAEQEPAVILVDTSDETLYQQFESSIQESVGLFSDKINANAIHFLSSENLESVPYLVKSPLFGHFVLRNYETPKAAGQHYGRIVRATIAERAFGLGNLLDPGAKVQTVTLNVTSQKQSAVDAVKNYLLAAKFKTRMATVIANAVDELLMNSMFDAPVDPLGRQLYHSTARDKVFALEGKAAVEMHVGFDGKYVGITAVDLFGSIDKVKLLSHLSKMYRKEEYKVKSSGAGAGIGLATVFRQGGSFFFVSESRVRTEVTVFFELTASFREFKDQFRFISTQFYF